MFQRYDHGFIKLPRAKCACTDQDRVGVGILRSQGFDVLVDPADQLCATVERHRPVARLQPLNRDLATVRQDSRAGRKADKPGLLATSDQYPRRDRVSASNLDPLELNWPGARSPDVIQRRRASLGPWSFCLVLGSSAIISGFDDLAVMG